jgi:dihydropteroate synthase
MLFKFLDKTPAECLAASITCATMAAQQGAQIIRVHDIEETMDAIKIVNYMKKLK